MTLNNSQFFDDPSSYGRPSKADLRKAKRVIQTSRKVSQASKPLVPRNAAQQEYLEVLAENDFTIALGPAGTGKTYLTARFALNMLLKGEVEKIVLTRPMVAVSGEEIGFLPGGVRAKVAPWAVPVMDAFLQGAKKDEVERFIREDKIEFVPFQFIRGRTFSNSYIIADESQNLTIEQFKVLITRVGEESRIVIDGDLRQSDLKVKNGLQYALDIFDNADSPELDGEVYEFGEEHVVRSKICAQWVAAISHYGD